MANRYDFRRVLAGQLPVCRRNSRGEYRWVWEDIPKGTRMVGNVFTDTGRTPESGVCVWLIDDKDKVLRYYNSMSSGLGNGEFMEWMEGDRLMRSETEDGVILRVCQGRWWQDEITPKDIEKGLIKELVWE